jgi:small-conductance mechanosensitive channel
MKRVVVLVFLLWLGAGAVQAQGPTPAVSPELADLAGVVREYVAELETAIPTLQQQLKSEDAALRQFEQYRRQMVADAAMQRTVLALGNARPPALAQAQRNWRGWQAVAEERLAGANDVAASAKQAQQDEKDRWALLGDESAEGLAAALGDRYQEAQALHTKKLTFLSRLQAIASRSANDAQAAIKLCSDIEEAIARTAERQQQRFLWTRAGLAGLPATLSEARADLDAVVAPFAGVSAAGLWRHVSDFVEANWVAVLTALLAGGALVWRSRLLKRSLRALADGISTASWMPPGLPRRFTAAAATALNRSSVTGIVAVVAVLLRMTLGANAPGWIQPLFTLAIALFAWHFVYALIAAALDPKQPEQRIAAMEDSVAGKTRRRLQRLAVWLLVATVAASLAVRGTLTAAPFILGFVIIELLALHSLHGLLADSRLTATGMGETMARWARRWRRAVRTASFVMIGLCGFGFLNLAWFVGWGMLKSSVLLALATLAGRLGSESVRYATRRLTARTRRSLRRMWTGAVGAAMLIALPFVWGIEAVLWQRLQAVLSFGVQFGDHRITVLRLLLAVGCVLGAWLTARVTGAILERRVFPRTLLDMGVRTAIVRSATYVLVVVGALAAVRTVGFDLTNLAIVAGALSVGIGFGLQTLVSNFVSGLIILFERPFKLGDLLEHEGVFGYVRRIRTRSTVLRTFDESEMVLPNADLLSHKITNWTLTDNKARAIVSVGVAYGSDVVKVRDILYQVAKEHPRVLDEPRVYFTAFGDSSLDFRLLVWLDIRERPQVLSDLHFAIDAAFREHSIQIPFPQRDLHIIRPNAE